MAEAGTLKPDFRALKCRNRVFFSWNTFLHVIEITKEKKPCWPYRHFKERYEKLAVAFHLLKIHRVGHAVALQMTAKKYTKIQETDIKNDGI